MSHRSHREIRTLLALAAPLSIGQLGLQTMNVVDALMLGRLDSASLGGAGLGNSVLFAVLIVGMGIVMGLDSVLPKALGAGRTKHAALLAHGGFVLALLVSVPVCLLICLCAVLLSHAGFDDVVVHEAQSLIWGRLFGCVPVLAYCARRSTLQAHGITKPLVVAMVVGNIVNVVFNWVLIFGDAGLEQIGLPTFDIPSLGSLGAGLSTSMVSTSIWLVSELAFRRLSDARSTFVDWGVVKEIVWLGRPIDFQLLAEVGIFTIVALVAGSFGVVASAAHQVVLSVSSYSLALAIGLSSSTSVLVGKALGAGKPYLARSRGWLGARFGAMSMGITGVVFACFPTNVARLFTDDVDVVEAAAPLLRIAALFQVSDAVQTVLSGALRGIGDNNCIFRISVFGYYAIGLPVSLIACYAFDLGVSGLWWGLFVGLSLVAVLYGVRFARLPLNVPPIEVVDEDDFSSIRRKSS